MGRCRDRNIQQRWSILGLRAAREKIESSHASESMYHSKLRVINDKWVYCSDYQESPALRDQIASVCDQFGPAIWPRTSAREWLYELEEGDDQYPYEKELYYDNKEDRDLIIEQTYQIILMRISKRRGRRSFNPSYFKSGLISRDDTYSPSRSPSCPRHTRFSAVNNHPGVADDVSSLERKRRRDSEHFAPVANMASGADSASEAYQAADLPERIKSNQPPPSRRQRVEVEEENLYSSTPAPAIGYAFIPSTSAQNPDSNAVKSQLVNGSLLDRSEQSAGDRSSSPDEIPARLQGSNVQKRPREQAPQPRPLPRLHFRVRLETDSDDAWVPALFNDSMNVNQVWEEIRRRMESSLAGKTIVEVHVRVGEDATKRAMKLQVNDEVGWEFLLDDVREAPVKLVYGKVISSG